MDFTTGNGPEGVAISDLDGDGKPDLATANYGSNTVSVFRNTSTNGSITSSSFAAKVDFTTGSSPQVVTISDLDGDGKPDLGVANYGNNSISVLQNTICSGTTPVSESDLYKIPKTTVVPVIDGNADPVWKTLDWTFQRSYSNGTKPPDDWADLFGASKLMYDNDNLYGIFYTQDEDPTGNDASIADWQRNGVEFYIDPDNSKDKGPNLAPSDFHMTFRHEYIGNEIGHIYIWGLPAGTDTTGIEWKIKDDQNMIGYWLEFKIPLATLNLSSVLGTVIGLEWHQNDNDGNGRDHVSKWWELAGDSSWQYASTWGTAILSDRVASEKLEISKAPAGTTVTIDGEMDPIYANANAITQNCHGNGTIYPYDFHDAFARTYLLYDDNNLYAFYDVYDDNPTGNDASVADWQGNGVELYIDPDNSKDNGPDLAPTDFQLRFRHENVGNEIGHIYTWGLPAGADTTGIEWKIKDDTIGYNVELKIPLQTLNLSALEGKVIGLEVQQDDNDGNLRESISKWWLEVGDSSWQYASSWGTAILGSAIPISWPVLSVNPASLAFGTIIVGAISSEKTYSLSGTNLSPASGNISVTAPTGFEVSLTSGSGFASTINAPYSGGIINTTIYVRFKPTVAISYSGNISNSGGGATTQNVSVSGLGNIVPAISSFFPTSGPIGTTVTITGTNFNTTAANNVVYFGAVKAQVTSASSTSLSVTVPVGATYQPITVTDLTTGLTAYSNRPFVVTFAGGGSITSTSFATKVDYTTGTNPWSVDIGDLDGDGKPDIATSNIADSSVSIFQNASTSGSVSFLGKVDFRTGFNPLNIAIKDVDGDGRPDLVVTNSGGSTVSILKNISTYGNISFAQKIDFASGTQGLAIADVDGDGKPDLVITNSGGSTISILKNISVSGSITTSSFAPKVDFTTGSSPANVAISDVDGDNKPDLVVTNSNSNTFSVLRNTCTSGSITSSSFATKVDFTAGTNPFYLAVGDLDGDDKPDLAVINYNSDNTLSIFKNTSTSGDMSFAAKVDYAAGSNPQGIALSDLDGDGKLDVTIANSPNFSILRNISTTSSINFAAKVEFTSGNNSTNVAIGDVDGDDKPDVIVANYGNNSISVFRNTVGNGTTPISNLDIYKIPKTTVVPVIDGNADPVWKTLDWTFQRSYSNGTIPPDDWADLFGASKLMYDDNNLYGIFYTQDEDPTGNDASIADWERNAVELYIDPDNSKDNGPNLAPTDFHFVFRHEYIGNEVGHIYTMYLPAGIDTTGIEWKLLDDQNMIGYWLEFKIPLAVLNIQPTAGKKIGLEWQLNDNDGSGREHVSKWWEMSGDSSWQYAGTWGTAILSDRVVNEKLEISKAPMGTTITIDGEMDPVYANVNAITQNCHGNGPSYPYDFHDAFMRTYLLYDDNNLYTYFDVYDDNPTGNDADVVYWERNAVEFYIDPDNSKDNGPNLATTDFHMTFRHEYIDKEIGNIYNLYLPEGTDTSGIEWKIKDDTIGYNVEFKIPLQTLNLSALEGKVIGLEAQQDDNDGIGREHISKWWEEVGDSSWQYASSWGTAKLGSEIVLPWLLAAPTSLVAVAVSSSQINLSWTDNSNNEDGFRIERKTGSSGNYSEIATVGSNTTSYSDIGFTLATQYIYRIRSFNSSGNSAYSNEAIVTIDTIPPSAPLNASITPAGWTNNSSFTLSWTNPSDSSGIAAAWISIDTMPTTLHYGTREPIASSSMLVSMNLYGIHTIYFYLEDGASNKDPDSHVSVVAKLDTLKPIITHDPSLVSSVVVQNGAVTSSLPSISASVSKTSGYSDLKSFQLKYRKAGQTAFITINYSNLTGGTTQIPSSVFMTNGVANGVDYQIVASDFAGNIAVTPVYSVTVINQTSVTAATMPPAASSYPEADMIKAYRMFSIPYDLNNKQPVSFIPNSLGDNTKDGKPYVMWRLMRLDDGGHEQDYDRFEYLDAFDVGKGFFLITRQANAKITVGSGKLVNSYQMYSVGIPLNAGWNLVGDPFLYDVLYDSLFVSGGAIIQSHAYYSGTGSNSGWEVNNAVARTLHPWMGLAIKVNQPTWLHFKNSSLGVTPKVSLPKELPVKTKALQKTSSNEGWILNVGVYRTDNGMKNIGNLIGMLPDAKDCLNDYDWYQPPLVGDKNVGLYFSKQGEALMRDLRAISTDGGIWEMKVVTGDDGARVQLHIDGYDNLIDKGFNVYVLDIDERMAYNIALQNDVMITTKNNGRNFKIVVGTKEFVEKNNFGIDLMPKKVQLFTNYPNPFNPMTIIRYTIPQTETPSYVTLKVYDLLGQEVATIVDGLRQAGYYEENFQASGLASGIYFYRIKVKDAQNVFVDTKKMVLLR